MNLKIGIVINTCKAYADVSIPPLLRSLYEAGVCGSNIVIVVGECSNDNFATDSNKVQWYFTRTYNIDNNAHICISQNTNVCAEFDWIVYLHDTCSVDPDVFLKSAKYYCSATKSNINCIRIHEPFSMGIGYYRTSWLKSKQVREYLQCLINYDVKLKSRVKCNLSLLEDTLFKFANPNEVETALPIEYNVISHTDDRYGTNLPRITEWYKQVGIYKHKANWGQSVQLSMQL